MPANDSMARLARLARLAPSEEGLARFSTQCDDIINYMNILSEVDTTGAEPVYSPLHQVISRPDEAEAKDLHGAVLGNAPESDGTFFIVPRIV